MVSLAFRTAVTVRGAKSRWRGVEEQQSFPHSSTSCSSTARTGTSGPAAAPPPRPDEDASGSSADTGQTPEALSATRGKTPRFLSPSLQASKTVELSSICSDTTVEN